MKGRNRIISDIDAAIFRKNVLYVKACKYDKVYHSQFDQLIRSATSITANLVEGKAGSSGKDWKNFYVMALKSANETKYWLCLIRDTMGTNKLKIKELIAEEISNIIGAIIVSAGKGKGF